MQSIVVLKTEDLKEIVKEAILEVERERVSSQSDATYSVAAVAKRLKMAHATVKKLIRENYLEITTNGRITERSIHEYLKKKQS